jgi:uncharacterized protein YggU (UPF0235/DUF167 family)
MKLKDFIRLNKDDYVSVVVQNEGEAMRFATAIVKNKANMHLQDYLNNAVTAIRTKFESSENRWVLHITVKPKAETT